MLLANPAESKQTEVFVYWVVSLQLFLILGNTKFNTKVKISSSIREEQINLFGFV